MKKTHRHINFATKKNKPWSYQYNNSDIYSFKYKTMNEHMKYKNNAMNEQLLNSFCTIFSNKMLSHFPLLKWFYGPCTVHSAQCVLSRFVALCHNSFHLNLVFFRLLFSVLSFPREKQKWKSRLNENEL